MKTTVTISKRTAIVASQAMKTILDISKDVHFVSEPQRKLVLDAIDEMSEAMNEPEPDQENS